MHDSAKKKNTPVEFEMINFDIINNHSVLLYYFKNNTFISMISAIL